MQVFTKLADINVLALVAKTGISSADIEPSMLAEQHDDVGTDAIREILLLRITGKVFERDNYN